MFLQIVLIRLWLRISTMFLQLFHLIWSLGIVTIGKPYNKPIEIFSEIKPKTVVALKGNFLDFGTFSKYCSAAYVFFFFYFLPTSELECISWLVCKIHRQFWRIYKPKRQHRILKYKKNFRDHSLQGNINKVFFEGALW